MGHRCCARWPPHGMLTERPRLARPHLRLWEAGACATAGTHTAAHRLAAAVRAARQEARGKRRQTRASAISAHAPGGRERSRGRAVATTSGREGFAARGAAGGSCRPCRQRHRPAPAAAPVAAARRGGCGRLNRRRGVRPNSIICTRSASRTAGSLSSSSSDSALRAGRGRVSVLRRAVRASTQDAIASCWSTAQGCHFQSRFETLFGALPGSEPMRCAAGLVPQQALQRRPALGLASGPSGTHARARQRRRRTCPHR